LIKTIADVSSAKERKVSHGDPQLIGLLRDNWTGENSLRGSLNSIVDRQSLALTIGKTKCGGKRPDGKKG
jgi:hypothetical protein